MHKKVIIGLLLIFIQISELLAQDKVQSLSIQNIATLQWGNANNEVALTKVPATNLGPISLTADNDTTYLLDVGNQRIVGLNFNKKPFTPIVLRSQEEITDFCLTKKGKFFILYGENHHISIYTKEGEFEESIKISEKITTPVSIQCSAEVTIDAFDGKTYYFNNQGHLVDFIPLDTYKALFIEKSNQEWVLKLNNQQAQKEILINAEQGTILNVDLMGMDNNKNIYLLLEEVIKSDTPEENILRFLKKYTPSGKLLSMMQLPYSSYAYMLKDLVVIPSGGVMQMIPLKEGLKLFKLYTAGKGIRSQGNDTEYQKLFNEQHEADDVIPSEAPMPKKKSSATHSQQE